MGILAIDQDDLRPGWLRVQVHERAEGRRQAVFLKRCPWGRHDIRFDSRSHLRACTRCGVRLTEPTARASAR
jgi:hypothetical protein